jgi:hypothetical protein
MQKMHKDKPVTVIRYAKEGDPGFVSAKSSPPPAQMLVRLQGGDHVVLNTTELSDAPEMVPVMEAKKAPTGSVLPSTARVDWSPDQSSQPYTAFGTSTEPRTVFGSTHTVPVAEPHFVAGTSTHPVTVTGSTLPRSPAYGVDALIQSTEHSQA